MVVSKRSIKECQDILEGAIDDTDCLIPEDVIRQIIDYLEELKGTKKQLSEVKRKLSTDRSNAMWEKFPDGGY